ncbi:MAG TPA: hypothetical protein PKE12_14865 [Kiritimatiellia bacterium]|nr:hypothetical protein [Kiritimatiellia bacterium]
MNRTHSRLAVTLALSGATVVFITATTALSRRPDPAYAPAPDAAPMYQGAGLRVRWQRPGEFFPVLGWRESVTLEASTVQADRQLAHLAPESYNCHFYTRFHLRRARGEAVLPIPRQDLLTVRCLRTYGYARIAGPSAPGDVWVAARPDETGGWIITHSAIVLETGPDGEPTRIRQKFDPRYPVVDVTPSEFRTLYAGCHPWRVEAWRATKL